MKSSSQKIYSNSGNPEVIELIPRGARLLLDVGCGDGSLAKSIANKDYVIDGITISDDEMKSGSDFMRKTIVYDLEEGLPKLDQNYYDAVICSHVLEHICYPQKLLADIYRVLKNDGILIVALPNLMHYKSRIELAKGNFYYQDAGIWDYTHFRWYTFDSAQSLLERNNFEVQVKTASSTIPLYSLLSKVLSARVCNRLSTLLISISPGFFGYQLLFTAKKK